MANRKDDASSRSHFWIDDLYVQPDRRLVMRGDEEIKLEKRMMEVLVELAHHGKNPVSKEALLTEFWSDDDGNELYTESALTKTISTLREKIGDDARNPRYIRTVSGHGYCIIPTVLYPEGYRHLHGDFGTWTRGNPYVGLKPFDERHADVFQGRSQTIADLMAAMRKQIDSERRFVLIVGPSGCGKTSLVRASMIPTISRQGGPDRLRALSVAACDLGTASDGDVMTTLAASLTAWTLGDQEVFLLHPEDILRKILTETPEKISAIIEESFRRCHVRSIEEEPYAHLLLTIDHAEALVAGRNIEPEQRAAFDRAIRALCDTPRILTTMTARLDFYPALSKALPELAEYRSGYGHFEMSTPKGGELAKIIRKPAALAGVDFEEHPNTQKFLDDLLYQETIAQPDALPLLQHTLHALYERCTETRQLTYAAYDEIGGLEGAIARRAEQVFGRLPAPPPDNLDRTLGRVLARLVIVQPDNDSVSACPIVRGRLDPEADQLVQAFIDAHLFVSDLDGGQPIVRVAHEALLRQWPRAAEWIEENRRLLQAKGRLQRAAERWAEEGESPDHLLNPGRPLAEAREVQKRLPEQVSPKEIDFLQSSEKSGRRKKIVRNIAIASLIFSVITSTSLAIYAFKAKNEAEANRQETLILIDYLLDELAQQLRPQSNLELLGSISHEALMILGSRRIEDMSAIELVRHSQSLTLIGEVSIKKGENEDAIKAFVSAMKAADSAHHKDSESTQVINQLGQVNYWVGLYHYNRNEFEKAEKYWKKYLTHSRDLVRSDGKNPKWKLEESYAINNLGTLYTDLGNYESALDLFEESYAIKQEAEKREINDHSLQIEVIDTLSWISKCHAFTGNLEQASEENRSIVGKLRELTRKDPKALAWRRRLANALARSAEIESLRKDNVSAQALITESIAILTDLTETNDDDKGWQRDLAYARMKAGDIALSLSQESVSRDHYAAAEDAMNRLLKTDKPNIEWERLRNMIRSRSGLFGKDTETREHTMSSAASALDDLFNQFPDDYSARLALADALARRAEHRQRYNMRDLAREDWNRIATIVEASSAHSKDPRIAALIALADEARGTP